MRMVGTDAGRRLFHEKILQWATSNYWARSPAASSQFFCPVNIKYSYIFLRQIFEHEESYFYFFENWHFISVRTYTKIQVNTKDSGRAGPPAFLGRSLS